MNHAGMKSLHGAAMTDPFVCGNMLLLGSNGAAITYDDHYAAFQALRYLNNPGWEPLNGFWLLSDEERANIDKLRD